MRLNLILLNRSALLEHNEGQVIIDHLIVDMAA